MRTALKPRWLALLGLLILVVVAFTMLGFWQLDVAKSKGAQEAVAAAQQQAREPLTDVIRPHQAFPKGGSLKPVTVTGHYDAAHQVLVSGRVLHGTSGYWVLTPLVVDATGARIAVIRGFVDDPAAARPPSTGHQTVTVRGALAPGESPSTGTHPKGQLGSVDLGLLLNRWGGQIYNAFIFKTSEKPDATAASIRSFPPPQPATGGLKPLNAGYALQWWIFAAFAIYLYWHMIDDDHRTSQGLPPRSVARRRRADRTGDNEEANSSSSSSKDAHV